MAKNVVKNMISPSVEELTQNGKYNRYTLVIATSKCARGVTDEYVKEMENTDPSTIGKEASKRRAELMDEKAVKIAINRISGGEYHIVDSSLNSKDED